MRATKPPPRGDGSKTMSAAPGLKAESTTDCDVATRLLESWGGARIEGPSTQTGNAEGRYGEWAFTASERRGR